MILKIKEFLHKYQRHLPPVAIFGGFVVDSFTLGRIDHLFGQIILGSYLIGIAVLIILINLIDAKETQNSFLKKNRNVLDFLMLFMTGNIFSGLTLFYSQSAGGFVNWIFVILMFGFLVSTEYFKKHYTRMTLQVSVFYLAVFTYLIFLIPVLTKKMGALVFILSGLVSLLIFYFYLFIFRKIAGAKFKETQKNIIKSVVTIFVSINIFYFINFIPPIPLSLKEADVFHSIKKEGGSYLVLDEDRSFFDRLTLYEKVRVKSGETIYFFSSVFAPTKLNTQIIHEWQYRDEKGRWITSAKIPFAIYGGSDYGYRGYSFKSNLTEGRWRVNVKTSSGQIIGRKVFRVEITSQKISFINKVL